MYASSGYLRQGLPMGKVSGLAIVCGCFLMVLGLAFLPAAFGIHPVESILGLGICVFSLCALTVAGVVYMKAHALKSSTTSVNAPKAQPKRIRGGVDLFGYDTTVTD